MNTGSQRFGRPSMGSCQTTYGLGSEGRDLPAYVVFSTGPGDQRRVHPTTAAASCRPSIKACRFVVQGDPVLYLSDPPGLDNEIQRASIERRRRPQPPAPRQLVGDPEIATRINNFELAYRMQSSAPDLMDLSKETPETLAMYGARPGQVVLRQRLPALPEADRARRPVRPGLPRSLGPPWRPGQRPEGSMRQDRQSQRPPDQGPEAARPAGGHPGNLGRRVRPNADGAGRQRRPGSSSQRVHHVACRRRRQAGGDPRQDRRPRLQRRRGQGPHVHDFHATILHTLGFDHTRLTFKFQGRHFRLTDVSGEVVKKLLA